MNPSLPVSERVELLLANMTMNDKLYQLQRPNWDPSFYDTGAGILEFQAVYANTRNATEVVQNRNRIQTQFLTNGPGARLNIPVSFRLFSIHGGEAYGTTFPEGPGIGATWNTDLATQIARVITSEARALGADIALYVINLWSDARFGRQQEGFSEEPMLTGAFAEAFVIGSQGGYQVASDAYLDNTTNTIAAFFKHVGAYGYAAGGINGNRADATQITVQDTYLKPWRRAAAAGARGVMPSHNTVLNIPAHASPWLLRDQLRNTFNMTKAVFISDTGDVQALNAFRLCSTDAMCAALAINAGVDIEQVPGTTYLSLPIAISQNLTTQTIVDNAVRRILNHKFSLRLFDEPYVNETLAEEVVNCLAHQKVALQAAEEGIVLLTNKNNFLPLSFNGTYQKIAILGPNGGCGTNGNGSGTLPLCSAQTNMLGNYAENLPPSSGVPTVAESFINLITNQGSSITVNYARGCNIDDNDLSLLPDAVTLATNSDVNVLVVGDSTSSCGESMDRDTLDLSGGQLALLQSISTLGKPIILVLINGRTVTFDANNGNYLLQNITALLVAWRPGQFGGTALSNIVFGLTNPSGKLPNQWVKHVGHIGSSSSPWLQQRVSLFGGPTTGAEKRTYGHYVNDDYAPLNPNGNDIGYAVPLFPFGYGISYSVFTLSNLSLTIDETNTSYPLTVTINLTNTGPYNGSHSFQIYLQDPIGVTLNVRPWKRLIGFRKAMNMMVHEVRQITVPIRSDDIAFIGDDYELYVFPGKYTVSVGFSSVDDANEGMVQEFTFTKDKRRLL